MGSKSTHKNLVNFSLLETQTLDSPCLDCGCANIWNEDRIISPTHMLSQNQSPTPPPDHTHLPLLTTKQYLSHLFADTADRLKIPSLYCFLLIALQLLGVIRISGSPARDL